MKTLLCFTSILSKNAIKLTQLIRASRSNKFVALSSDEARVTVNQVVYGIIEDIK